MSAMLTYTLPTIQLVCNLVYVDNKNDNRGAIQPPLTTPAPPMTITREFSRFTPQLRGRSISDFDYTSSTTEHPEIATFELPTTITPESSTITSEETVTIIYDYDSTTTATEQTEIPTTEILTTTDKSPSWNGYDDYRYQWD